jgi:hypothetical protein|nr:MAG TPA: protein of unknown function (DUF4373) [Caudoviricetes sp.]
MAKSGIDYFPLDVTLNAKFELIEAEFGLTGFGVVVHLLQEIYGKAGYYIEWTEEVALLFARKVGLGGSVVSEIIGASIRRGMFDKEKYDKYHVLTSKGIQERYFEAVSRRKTLEVDYNILLVDVAKILPNAYISAKNVNIFSKNADIERQSKVEKSRVEKSKEEYILCAEPQAADAPPVISLPLNDGTFFDVSENDRAKWSQLYPNVDVLQQLRNMAGWCDANPSKRKTRNGIKRFITSWLAREQDKGRGPVAPAQQGKNVQPSGNNGWMKDFLKGG